MNGKEKFSASITLTADDIAAALADVCDKNADDILPLLTPEMCQRYVDYKRNIMEETDHFDAVADMESDLAEELGVFDD